jgi:hypothetical protein
VLSAVDVSSELVSSVDEDDPLSLLQEMMVRLKQEIRKMNKTFFIFSLMPKVKYVRFGLGEPNI